jgi:hypothetical protein
MTKYMLYVVVFQKNYVVQIKINIKRISKKFTLKNVTLKMSCKKFSTVCFAPMVVSKKLATLNPYNMSVNVITIDITDIMKIFC